MDLVGMLESFSLGMCGIAMILWMSIGTLSKTTQNEILTQRIIAFICISSSLLLFVVHYSGGELWGSRNIARPFAVISIIVAIASIMNIKGTEIQKGSYPKLKKK
ncbi:MAG: hypothetical protein CL993_02545 [Euryarchaeota archaeon]|nr:hypothetical protein [Euryarchaeota archaeon]